jgi:CRISPR system Cascade subunit CasA
MAAETSYCLLDRSWLPARRADGTRAWVRPADITAEIDRNPVVAIEWSRPDLDAATREFLIGLLSAACFGQASDRWAEWFETPPTPDMLDRAFAPLRHAFALDGAGPRFLQDIDELEGDPVPVSQLLIEAPGANALKKNLDHFVHRGRVEVLSRAAAAMVLFTLQTYAPTGGAGHRVGLRGGGPLSTLVQPETLDPSGGAPSAVPLWHLLWANLPIDETDEPPAAFDKTVFPWLGPTRSSEKELITTPADVHPLQALWGMPRRIRLDFEPNTERRPCDLTGQVDDVIVRTYRTRPYGTRYVGFLHPLSPHYRPKAGDNAGWLPVHGQPGRIGWRHWLGLVQSDDEGKSLRQPAKVVPQARRRLRHLTSRHWRRDHARLVAAGYDMDNMKARDFIESEMPLHLLDDATAREYDPAVRELVGGGVAAEGIVSWALRSALFGKEAPNADAGVRALARNRFWDGTEQPFRDLLAVLAKGLSGADEERIRVSKERLRDRWHDELRRQAIAIFDELVPFENLEGVDLHEIERRIAGRRYLTVSLAGYGPSGDAFFKALGKPPPEKTKKASKQRQKGKTRDDRAAL